MGWEERVRRPGDGGENIMKGNKNVRSLLRPVNATQSTLRPCGTNHAHRNGGEIA